MAGRVAIIRYMLSKITEYFNEETREVDYYALAEDAEKHFGYDADCDVSCFEQAYYVARRYEIRMGISEEKIKKFSGLIDTKESSWF